MIVDQYQHLYLPPTISMNTNPAGSAGAAHTMTALIEGNKFLMGLIAPKTGEIKAIAFRIGTVTTGGSVDLRMETPAANSQPSTTLWGTNTSGSVAIASGDANTLVVVNLTANASVTAGDQFFVVGTVAGTGASFQHARSAMGYAAQVSVQTWVRYYTSGAWANSSGPVNAYVIYSDDTEPYIPGSFSQTSVESATFTTGMESGIVVTVPWAARMVGLYDLGPWYPTYRIYDADLNLVKTHTVTNVGFNSTGYGIIHRIFPEPLDLTANATYYAVSVSASGSGKKTAMVFPTSRRGWYPFARCARNSNSGAFTVTETSEPFMGILLTGFGGGGGTILIED